MESHYLVLVPNYWGKGESLRVAIARTRDHGFGSEVLTKDNARFFRIQWNPDELPDDVDGDTVVDNFYVDNMGRLYTPDIDGVELDRWTFGNGETSDGSEEADLDTLMTSADMFAADELLTDYDVGMRYRLRQKTDVDVTYDEEDVA